MSQPLHKMFLVLIFNTTLYRPPFFCVKKLQLGPHQEFECSTVCKQSAWTFCKEFYLLNLFNVKAVNSGLNIQTETNIFLNKCSHKASTLYCYQRHPIEGQIIINYYFLQQKSIHISLLKKLHK